MARKIAFVTDAVYPYNKGGKEKRIYEISKRLAASGYEVSIYCMKWWAGPGEITRDGVRYKAISPLYQLYSGERRSVGQGIKFGLTCLRLLRESFDVVDVDHMPFFPLYFTRLVCILKRKKMFATWHEVWGREYWLKYMGFPGIFGYLAERLSVYLPNHITAVSEITASRLRGILRYEGSLTVVPNGVDFEKIAKIKPSAEKFDIVYAGRLLKHKNVDLLIKAAAAIEKSMPEIRCLIIGEGPEKKSLIMSAGKNIEFRDFLEKDEDLYAIFKSAKVFVLPSVREGFGLVAVEANACGLAVIAVEGQSNALSGYIQNGKNGYISRPSSEFLAENIVRAIENSEQMRQSCIAAAAGYDWDHTIMKLKDMYRC